MVAEVSTRTDLPRDCKDVESFEKVQNVRGERTEMKLSDELERYAYDDIPV